MEATLLFQRKWFNQKSIQKVIESSGKQECAYFYGKFYEKANEAKANKDENTFNALYLIANCASLRLNEKNVVTPYEPILLLGDKRSASLGDFIVNELTILAEIADDILSHELKARIYDILWLRLRKTSFAASAISNYLEIAREIENLENWSPCVKRLERALRLASQFKRNKPELFNAVVEHIVDVINRADCTDPLFLTLKLVGLLREFKQGNVEHYLHLVESIGEQAELEQKWNKAEEAWRESSEWAKLKKDEKKRNKAFERLAECHVKRADEFVEEDKPSYLGASHWLQKAIEIYKKVPDSKIRRDQLYQKLLGFQKKSLGEMKAIETPGVNIQDIIERSKKAVRGKDFVEALFALVFASASPPNYEKAKKNAEDALKTHPLTNMFPGTSVDSEGKVVAHVPSGWDTGDEAKSQALWVKTLMEIRIYHGLEVQGAIEPARCEILYEHFIDEDDFYNIVVSNPFIPPGHEYVFTKGLYAGLTGDFITATHILIPQLENSLRYVLQQQGVIVSTLNTHGVQEQLRIGTILEKEELVDTLGKDHVFDLRALLIDRNYANLRNEVSHGFMQVGEFYQPATIYLWWLILRLCLVPMYLKSKDEEKEEVSTASVATKAVEPE